MAAWRAGAWPTPPCTTLPKITSEMSDASTPARSTAARIAAAPSWGAVSGARPPRKRPIGVRAAERMTASGMECKRPRCDLVCETGDEISDWNGGGTLLLTCAAHADGDRVRLRFAGTDHRQVRNLHEVSFPYAVLQGFGARIEMGANARGDETFVHGSCRWRDIVRQRQNAYLFRREPDRKRARVVLDQATDEALHRADEDAVQHDRTVRLIVGTGVLELESLREIEVELHGRALPVAADRIDELEVELWTVESAAAGVDLVLLIATLEHLRQGPLSLGPHFGAAQ